MGARRTALIAEPPPGEDELASAGQEAIENLGTWPSKDVGIVEGACQQRVEHVVRNRQGDKKESGDRVGSHRLLSSHTNVVLPIAAEIAVVKHLMLRQAAHRTRRIGFLRSMYPKSPSALAGISKVEVYRRLIIR